MANVLVGLLVAVALAAVAWWAIDKLNPPEMIRRIAYVVLVVVFVLWCLNLFGAFGPGNRAAWG